MPGKKPPVTNPSETSENVIADAHERGFNCPITRKQSRAQMAPIAKVNTISVPTVQFVHVFQKSNFFSNRSSLVRLKQHKWKVHSMAKGEYMSATKSPM